MNYSADFIQKEYEKIYQKAEQAEASPQSEAWIPVIAEWNTLTSSLTGEFNRLFYRFNQNMRDAEAESRLKTFQSEIKPQHEQGDFHFAQLLLKSQKKTSIDSKYGSYFLERFKVARITLDPVNSALRIRIRELKTTTPSSRRAES